MANTEAQVCNLALRRIGQRQSINSLNEDTPEAQACKDIFADTRDAVLADMRWKFATRRAVLAELTETRTGWAHVYALPADCISPSYLHPGTRTPSAKERLPFDEELNDAGSARVLLADQSAAELVYVARVIAPPLWHPHFVQALAWRLAYELTFCLPVKPQVALAMMPAYRQALAEARASNLNTGQEDAPPDSEIITSRL